MKELITGAIIVNEGRKFRGYVLVKDEFISAVGEGDPDPELTSGADVVTNLCGGWLLPGVIDTHVHFRDGGDGANPKGNFASESRAALEGGVTTVFDMPNTVPPTVSLRNLAVKTAHAAETSAVNYAFFLGATDSNLQELISADYSSVPGVKVFMGASTGNMLVDDDDRISRIFSSVGAVKAVHAENQRMLDANLRLLREKYPDGNIPVWEHPAWRSADLCISATEKAMETARKTGARLHVCHVSTAAEASLFDAGSVGGKRITAETCPQYLYFGGVSDYQRLGAQIKCNPAIKERSDADALLEALAEGRIDTIATDHAPHLLSDKQGSLTQAASGMPGVQFSLRLMLELSFRNPCLTIERVVELMSHNPAEIFGIQRRGFIRPGMYADLVAVRRCDSYHIGDSQVVSACGWTPYAGIELTSEITKVWLNGTTSKPMQVKFSHNE